MKAEFGYVGSGTRNLIAGSIIVVTEAYDVGMQEAERIVFVITLNYIMSF